MHGNLDHHILGAAPNGKVKAMTAVGRAEIIVGAELAALVDDHRISKRLAHLRVAQSGRACFGGTHLIRLTVSRIVSMDEMTWPCGWPFWT